MAQYIQNTAKKIVYYVTGNPSKFALFAQFIPANASIELKQFECNLIEEQIENQEEIALSKAKQAWEKLKKPLLVDEVGVFFHKYNNFPGAFTKFVYKGLGFEGIYKLMENGDGLTIQLIVVYAYGPSEYKVFKTQVAGFFKKPLDGIHDKNAPFDAVFVPKGFNETYTELEKQPAIYNEIYFRALAMKEILEFISLPKFQHVTVEIELTGI